MQFKCQTVLFDPLIGPYQVLPPRVSEPERDGNGGVLHIPLSSKSGAEPSDSLMSYPESLTPVQRSNQCILQHQPTMLPPKDS